VGVVVPDDLSKTLTVALSAAVAALIEVGYYVAGRWIEMHYPAAGRVLLSLGLVGRSPTYIRR
jgi:hypothetical protein